MLQDLLHHKLNLKSITNEKNDRNSYLIDIAYPN